MESGRIGHRGSIQDIRLQGFDLTEYYTNDIKESTSEAAGDVVEEDSGAVYQDEDESSADDGGDPGHEQVEAGEQGSYSHSTNIHIFLMLTNLTDEEEDFSTDPAADNSVTSPVFSSMSPVSY